MPSVHWENYPNAYGSPYSTKDTRPENPNPPSNYNGKPCQIRWQSITFVRFSDCFGVFDGKWDSSQRGCVECDDIIQKKIHFGADGELYGNKCETACGATDSRCDEIPPGGSGCVGNIKRTCDSNCNFVSDVNCNDYGSTYNCLDGVCKSKSSGGGGCGGTPWTRCVHLGTTEFPLYYIIIPIIILAAIFAFFKFFAKKI